MTDTAKDLSFAPSAAATTKKQPVALEGRRENPLRGIWNRWLQALTLFIPGAQSARVILHRARGVKIGKNTWISFNVILETSNPQLITIEDGAFIGIGAIVIAHFKEARNGVRIGKDAFVGPGVIILPDVDIGDGAVVAAGSVVTTSVPPMTVVQGNPAMPIAKCSAPLGQDISLREFYVRLRPVHKPKVNKEDVH